MTTLSFSINDLETVTALAKTYSEKYGLRPTTEDLFNGDLYPGGVPIDADGKTEQEVESNGGIFWPSSEKIDTTKIELQLQLVGDQGVYLMTNVKYPKGETPSSQKMVVYASGCNPEEDEDFYENKCQKFGGDDGSVSLPIGWVEHALKKGKNTFSINLNRNSVKLNA